MGSKASNTCGVGITVKFNVKISLDMCLVHDNKFVGNVSYWESYSSTTPCTLNTKLTSMYKYGNNLE